MPRIAELREIDGALWVRVDMSLGSPIELLSPDEIEANREREMKYLDDIEWLRATLAAVRDDLSSVSITGEELHEIIARINDTLKE